MLEPEDGEECCEIQMCIAFTPKLTAVRVTRRKLHKINPRRSVNAPADIATGIKELREGERGEGEGEQETKVGMGCVGRCVSKYMSEIVKE